MNALGIDVSKYNGPVNWEVAKENGVTYAGMRASISWGYRDPWIGYNLSECKRLGIFIMPYHVLYPGENVPRQVDNFLNACAVSWEFEIPVLDLELTHGQSKATHYYRCGSLARTGRSQNRKETDYLQS